MRLVSAIGLVHRTKNRLLQEWKTSRSSVAGQVVKTPEEDKGALEARAWIEAQALVTHSMGLRSEEEIWTASKSSKDLVTAQNKLEVLIRTRLEGTPLAYITKHQEFWGLDFMVNGSVLIPRPCSETVIETAVNLYSEMFCLSHESMSVMDIGTGSGCLLISFIKEINSRSTNTGTISGVGLDVCPNALAVAKENADR